MPIYAYKCEACGHAQDILRKISDPPLDTCPQCGAQAFSKQVTAAGFQLKGSGWYVTDFRGGANSPAADKADAKPADAKAADAPAPASADAKTAAPAAPAAAAKSEAPAPSKTPASTGSGPA